MNVQLHPSALNPRRNDVRHPLDRRRWRAGLETGKERRISLFHSGVEHLFLSLKEHLKINETLLNQIGTVHCNTMAVYFFVVSYAAPDVFKPAYSNKLLQTYWLYWTVSSDYLFKNTAVYQ